MVFLYIEVPHVFCTFPPAARGNVEIPNPYMWVAACHQQRVDKLECLNSRYGRGAESAGKPHGFVMFPLAASNCSDHNRFSMFPWAACALSECRNSRHSRRPHSSMAKCEIIEMAKCSKPNCLLHPEWPNNTKRWRGAGADAWLAGGKPLGAVSRGLGARNTRATRAALVQKSILFQKYASMAMEIRSL